MVLAALLILLVASSAILAAPATDSGLDSDSIAKVKANLETIAIHSWEIGTELETLTELEWPDLSVFHGSVPPALPSTRRAAADVIAKATAVVNNITNPTVIGPLIDGDGAVGDPASLGVAVLLTNWTTTDTSGKFAIAAQNQLEYLLYVAPRTADGAISHRESEVQLWADFVYMAPPFIAYYGAIKGGENGTVLLTEAYNQCRLYRQYLSDESGLWKHIVLGSDIPQDLNHWGTGNAWAAAGMMRVLESITRSSQADYFETEKINLINWIDEILTAAWSFQHFNGTLYNFIDQDTSFADSSSTALLGAVSFRLATISSRGLVHIPNAYRALQVIKNSINEDGWLLNTVDPETFNTPSLPGIYSPEGQAFVLLLHSAERDFVKFFQ